MGIILCIFQTTILFDTTHDEKALRRALLFPLLIFGKFLKLSFRRKLLNIKQEEMVHEAIIRSLFIFFK